MSSWSQWLVSFDTDRIKEYLFVTNKLKEIRGGSALLTKLDAEREKQLVARFGDQNLVYSAGGGAAILVPDNDAAESLRADVEREFVRRTVTASITGVVIPPEPKPGASFGERMKRAAESLRKAKRQKAELFSLPAEPYFYLCKSCGRYPAAQRARDGSGDLLCASCAVKRQHGAQARSASYEQFVAWAKEHGDQSWESTDLPEDLDALGSLSSPPNYVGFMALDGNQMGELLDRLPNVPAYGRYSKGLADLIREQVFAALQRYGKPREARAPFEIILIGGDDVLLMTAADIALDVALVIALGFEGASAALLKQVGLDKERARLTLAGGVVLAHAGFPIAAMHELAEALLRSAKKECAQAKYETGALDFLVVSGGQTDLDEARAAIPHRRPYRLQDMGNLLQHTRKLKAARFPTTQLQTMYQALFTNRTNAQLAAIRTLAWLNRGDRQQHDQLKQFFVDFGVQFKTTLPPWDASNRTALADLVQIYPFIDPGGGNA